MTKNAPSKITIHVKKTQLYTILLIILWLTFILVLCSTHNFHWIITKLKTCFHICSLLSFVHIILTYYLHNYKKSYKFIHLWFMKQKKVYRRLSIMHNIKMTPSWSFTNAKYKSIFPFSPFALTSILCQYMHMKLN
jgi:hypothetical protein